MNCRFCGQRTQVIDTRHRHGDLIRRRRRCRDCGEQFTTYEIREDEWQQLREALNLVEKLNTFTRHYSLTKVIR